MNRQELVRIISRIKNNTIWQERLLLEDADMGAESALAIIRALKENISIPALALKSFNIGTKEAKTIAEVLSINKALSDFGIIDTKIGDDGATAFAEAIKMNETLKLLALEFNNIRAKGAEAIAEAFKVNRYIDTLYFAENEIGDDGATAFAEALRVNKTLKFLDLRNTNMGDAGAEALSEALRVNKTLTILDIRDNYIGARGAEAIADALNDNYSIIKLLGVDDIQVQDFISRNRKFAKKIVEQLHIIADEKNAINLDYFIDLANSLFSLLGCVSAKTKKDENAIISGTTGNLKIALHEVIRSKYAVKALIEEEQDPNLRNLLMQQYKEEILMFEHKFACIDFSKAKFNHEANSEEAKLPLLSPEIEGMIVKFALEPKLNNPAMIAEAQNLGTEYLAI